MNTLANVGLDLAYLDHPDFIKFWDEDAARIETAIREIGRVQCLNQLISIFGAADR